MSGFTEKTIIVDRDKFPYPEFVYDKIVTPDEAKIISTFCEGTCTGMSLEEIGKRYQALRDVTIRPPDYSGLRTEIEQRKETAINIKTYIAITHENSRISMYLQPNNLNEAKHSKLFFTASAPRNISPEELDIWADMAISGLVRGRL